MKLSELVKWQSIAMPDIFLLFDSMAVISFCFGYGMGFYFR